jgi:hypothetical protein
MSTPNEISEYAARHGIPTIHEAPTVDGDEDIEVRRLRADLHMLRYNLERLAGPHPDGTAGTVENVARRGNARDPGHGIDALAYNARAHGLAHPQVAATLSQLAAWESRLSADFEAVCGEYLDWHRQQFVMGERKMYATWAAAE